LEHLGGKFSIDSAPGRGCKVTVMAPLRQDKHILGDKA
jgi:signal transduction histidine kinase